MAYLTKITCSSCRRTVDVAVGAGRMPPTVCPACEKQVANAQRTTALDALKTLPLDERVARIEAWIYDHSQVQHGYIEAPRF